MTTEVALPNLAAMEDFGRRIAARVRPGDVVALSGGLGAGKTTLARSIIAALGYDGEVPSPTFTILETYDRDHFTWRGVAHGRLDGRSRVDFSLADGLDRVRVVVVGTKGWADGVSRTVRLRAAT